MHEGPFFGSSSIHQIFVGVNVFWPQCRHQTYTQAKWHARFYLGYFAFCPVHRMACSNGTRIRSPLPASVSGDGDDYDNDDVQCYCCVVWHSSCSEILSSNILIRPKCTACTCLRSIYCGAKATCKRYRCLEFSLVPQHTGHTEVVKGGRGQCYAHEA